VKSSSRARGGAENPFDEETTSSKGPFEDEPHHVPPSLSQKTAVQMPTTQYSAPSPSPDLVAKAQRLRQREEELNRKEAMLDKKAQTLSQREKNGGDPIPPNWPRCKPLIRHNIIEDMPTPETVRLVRMAYGGWIAAYVLLGINIIVLLATLIQEGGGKAIGDFVLSIVFFILLPIIWFLIYRILYRAARKTKPALYIVYWIFFVLVILSHAFFVVGFPGTGAGGIFYMFQEFSNGHVASGVMLLISTVLWGVLAAFCILIFIYSRVQYSRAGGLEAAKKNVKDATVSAVRENPDLVKKGVKAAANEASKHPDILIDAAKYARE